MSIASDSNTDTVEGALAAAAKDATKIGQLLDALKTARLWLPLPDDGTPVITGTAVTLPTVSYLGSDFVPAYSSAEMLRRLMVPEKPTRVPVPHAVVRAADLARLLPPSVGIALNAGASESVPVYPQGVAYLAADSADPGANAPAGDAGDRDPDGRSPDSADPMSFGPLPPAATGLLAAVGSALAAVPQVSQAAAAWLTIRFSGEGLVISVTLDEPADGAARDAAMAAIERAAADGQGAAAEFPIDVTFPGEGEPDRIDDWFTSRGTPFYQR